VHNQDIKNTLANLEILKKKKMNKNKSIKKIKELTIRLAPSLLTLKPNPYLVIFIILLKSGDTSGNWTNNYLSTTPTTLYALSHHKPPQYQHQSYPPHITFFLLAYQTRSTTTIKWNRTSPSLLAIHNTITFIESLTKP